MPKITFMTRSLPAAKIRERHELILPIIGAYDEEKWAYELSCLLPWLLPLLVLVSSVTDLLLLLLYTYTLHPWAALLGMNQQIQTDKRSVQKKVGQTFSSYSS